jgi:ribose 5-phosphate isomerase B
MSTPRPALEEIARRAARAALEGSAAVPAEGSSTSSEPASPAPARDPGARGRTLVDARALAPVPAGETLEVPHEALVTPLALEEAELRGVRLARGATPGVRARTVAVGCDHGGLALKADLLQSLRELGARPVDFGTRDPGAVDYPDFARAVAEAVASGQCELGVVIDGAGIGSAIAASKVPGVRAATCVDAAMAASAREHNHANVLALGAGRLGAAAAHEVLRAFLTTEPGPGRHARRVAKIDAIEQRYARRRREGER